jgi:hypothetical protein
MPNCYQAGRMDWNMEARRILKFEMRIREITYKELIRRLAVIDVTETERSVASKVSRGTFSAAFFLQCMRAMDVSTLDVSGKPVTSAKHIE